MGYAWTVPRRLAGPTPQVACNLEEPLTPVVLTRRW